MVTIELTRVEAETAALKAETALPAAATVVAIAEDARDSKDASKLVKGKTECRGPVAEWTASTK
jgi:hypothetical protein